MPACFSPPLDFRRISAALAGRAIGCEVQVHPELPSTNDFATALGMAGYPHGLVVIAESQSAGRGRRENRWHAPPGRDLLLTVLLRPAARMECWPRMTAIAALAVCRAIESVCPLHALIKWPNDVYIRDRKVAGILGETFTSGSGPFMVLGIGLNVNSNQFTPDLGDTATSLLLEGGSAAALDRNVLAIVLLKQFDHLFGGIESAFDKILLDVKNRGWLMGKKIIAQVAGVSITGTAVDLNSEGHLVMDEGPQGTLRVLTNVDQVRVVKGGSGA